MDNNVWTFKGRKHGPAVCIVGGTHGNERVGIEVVYKLIYGFQRGMYTVSAGSLTLAIGNERAVRQKTRTCEDGIDLNRMFSAKKLQEFPQNYTQARAQELAKIIAHQDIVIDLHGTNTHTKPFAMMQPALSDISKTILQALSIEHTLVDPKLVFGGGIPVSLDEYASQCGAVGICYEIGYARDVSYMKKICDDMIRVLSIFDMMSCDMVNTQKASFCIYQMQKALLLQQANFKWKQGVGEQNFETVSKGDVLGYYGYTPVIAEADGVMIFPKVKKLREVGKPFGYIAQYMADTVPSLIFPSSPGKLYKREDMFIPKSI